ncbi:hypothetical protein AcV7_001893 [Taiwanofungus camphoratus]|nr:hypothetical protein AcV7_001893 [Antrodia cinnamomea]
MKFTTVLLSAAAVLVAVSSRPVKRDVDPNLVPEFGVQAGVNPDGTGNCDGIDGANGQPILIPCQCPPDRNTFIEKLNANVASGHVIENPSVQLTFPSDNSTASQLARIDACLVTLQNLNGTGVGCPASSTTFVAQQKAIAAESSSPSAATPAATTAVSSVAAVASATSTSTAASSASSGVDPNLVPQFGVQAGVNPDGTGNCNGINGSNGQPILIPCQCPPDRVTFIEKLSANVAAGHVIENPSVQLTFPSDNSTASQLARINAALVTLQNLNGTGVGCPASSTTFVAQQKAIAAETSSSSVVPTTQAAIAASSSSAASASPTSSPGDAASTTASNSTSGVDPDLVPQFGVQAGVNPDGTGNCDGINGANGQPILIPCQCPPNRDSFIQELSANVAAGFVLNNPSVKLTFPSDNSTASQLARLNAATVTLQNLNGTGVGCPVAATTFSAQQKAIEAESS